MSPAVTTWDAVLFALADQHLHPDKRGGGMIGKTAAVLDALGLTGDESVDSLNPKPIGTLPPPDGRRL